MANYSNLKAAIAAAIKQNGNQEITGQVLQNVLTSMVSVIGANYTFAGVATPSTNPGTPDQNVVYMASQAGTYTNFGGIQLPAGISLLMWNGAWTAQTFFVIDEEPIAGSKNLIRSGAVASSVYIKYDLGLKIRKARYIADYTITVLVNVPNRAVTNYYHIDTDKIYIFAPHGFMVSVNQTPSLTSLEFADTGWQNAENGFVTALDGNTNKYFVVTIKRTDNGNITDSDGIMLNNMVISKSGTLNELNTEIVKININKICSPELTSFLKEQAYLNSEGKLIYPTDTPWRTTDFIDINDIKEVVFGAVWVDSTARVLAFYREPNINSCVGVIGAGDGNYRYFDIYEESQKFTDANYCIIGYPQEREIKFYNREIYKVKTENEKEFTKIEQNNTHSHIAPFDNSYYGLGYLFASRKLYAQLETPVVDISLTDRDALFNTAGKLILVDNFAFAIKGQHDNTEVTGTTECQYQYIVKVNLDTMETDFVMSFDNRVPLNIDGVNYTVNNYMEGNIVYVNNQIVQTCLAVIDSDFSKTCMVTKIYDTDLNLQSTNLCYIKTHETSDYVLFNNTNLQNTQIGVYRRSCTIFNAGLAKYNGYFYGVCKFSTLVLLRSMDMIHFELVKVLETDYQKYHGEVGININSRGIAHLAFRFGYGQPTWQNRISKYDANTWEEIEHTYITGTCSMLTFFRHNNKLYLLSPGDNSNMDFEVDDVGRRNYKITYIDENYLQHSRIICDTSGKIFGPNTNVIEYNGYLYGCLTGKNFKLAQFTIPAVTLEEVVEFIDTVNNIS